MLERYGHCAKHGGTCNNCANKPGFLRHNVLLLDCRTLERISSTGPAANHSGIEGKRVLSDVCSHKSGHKSARPVLRQVRQLRRYSPQWPRLIAREISPLGHRLGLASLMDDTAPPLPFQLAPLSSSRPK